MTAQTDSFTKLEDTIHEVVGGEHAAAEEKAKRVAEARN